MKNFTIGLNFILVIAVAVLFYFQFSSPKTKTPTTAGGSAVVASGDFRIAYFEMDSVENQYEFLKDVRSVLRTLEEKKSGELASLRNASRSKLLEYQKKGNSMSQEEMAKANDDLMRMDNELKTQEQIKSQELQDESIKKIQEVKKSIEAYLKEFNKNKNYSYILSSSNDIIYLKDTTYNITNELIQGLNETYKKTKKK
ncbi:MAG TPA: OmpH family outer membrane protein [Chitinophagaceae bacterium]|jgi:outer membrane protein|nr:OmpH family outer membrane protein [Chitinophagaceae bacterium]MBP9741355.1 OmpH family outer membrane protein [Chitinophagaceae bacterium]HPH23440.1 OmpH family outer membrane protein [Chitinophagaceae bacterium]